jgi:DNA-binding NtrC family response regulator
VTVDLPALRARREDILPLAEHFLKKYAKENDRPVRSFSAEVVEFMLNYDWPGNVRELENMIERGVVLSKDKAITLAEFPQELTNPAQSKGKTLEALERNHILKVLEDTGGNIARSAKMLGIHRMTLYNKLKKYDINVNILDT